MRIYLLVMLLCTFAFISCGPSKSSVDNAVAGVLKEWSDKYMGHYLNEPIQHTLSDYQCENSQCNAVVDIEYVGAHRSGMIHCPFCKGTPKGGKQDVRLIMTFDQVGDNLHFKSRRVQ